MAMINYSVDDPAFVIRRGAVCDFDATGPFRKIFMGYEAQP
jgi:hypothetical protein